jgi:hypothetical protein
MFRKVQRLGGRLRAAALPAAGSAAPAAGVFVALESAEHSAIIADAAVERRAILAMNAPSGGWGTTTDSEDERGRRAQSAVAAATRRGEPDGGCGGLTSDEGGIRVVSPAGVDGPGGATTLRGVTVQDSHSGDRGGIEEEYAGMDGASLHSPRPVEGAPALAAGANFSVTDEELNEGR